MEKEIKVTGVKVESKPINIPVPGAQKPACPENANEKEIKQPKMTVSDLQKVIVELSDKIAKLNADSLIDGKITYKIVIEPKIKNLDVTSHFISDILTKGGMYTEGPNPEKTYILYKSRLQMKEDIPVYVKSGYPTLYIRRVVPMLLENCVYLYLRS